MSTDNPDGGDFIIRPGDPITFRSGTLNDPATWRSDLVFQSASRELFRVESTGKIVLNKDVPLDEISEAFWTYVRTHGPIQVQAADLVRAEVLDEVIGVLEGAGSLEGALEILRDRRGRL